MLAPAVSPEALAQFFQQANDKARSGNQPLSELVSAAELLIAANQDRLAVELYKSWIAFSQANSSAYVAYFNLAISLGRLADYAGAINALNECSRLAPEFWAARINLGRAYEDSGFIGKALEQWNIAIAGLSAVNAESQKIKLLLLEQSGRVLEAAESLEAAENVLRQAMELRPDRTGAAQHWVSLRQRQCKWPVVQPSEFVSSRQIIDGISPIALALHGDDPFFQLAKAYRYNKGLVGDVQPLRAHTNRTRKSPAERLRIGYVSSDLREHAVGFALVELFELHDRAKFEIFAYCFGEDRPADETQQRFKAAVDHWNDITALDDERAATEIAADEIDILVDLNGYTRHARASIFARRPAPIIVNWCGYPGTMGSPYHQYLIADGRIIPPENERFYSEKVLRLACNQPLDRKRKIAWDALTRADEGLPYDAFVFCCLNGMQKITPEVFSLWMTILRLTPNSVMWLLSGTSEVDQRLRTLAAEKGVAPERLFFAQKRPNPQHLARMALADLFLDTFPYGAHSTAADAITAGVPVLTRPGRGFASRFCASVVHAAGLDELVCASFEDYVQKAIAIGLDRRLAQRYRAQLAQRRDGCALRDMDATARRLEELYEEMQRARDADALPIPNLANLDVYYDIGAELDPGRIEQMDDSAYLAFYRKSLEQRGVPTEARL